MRQKSFSGNFAAGAGAGRSSDSWRRVLLRSRLGDDNRLDPETVAKSVRALGKDARVLSSSQEIADTLAAESQPGDLLFVMSNGSFDGLCDKLIKKLGGGPRALRGHQQVILYRLQHSLPTLFFSMVCLAFCSSLRANDSLRSFAGAP